MCIYMNVNLNVPLPLTNSLSVYMWSLSGHHYGDKETMDNISILHEVQNSIIIFSGDVQGDGTQGGFTIRVVTTMVTKRHTSSSD